MLTWGDGLKDGRHALCVGDAWSTGTSSVGLKVFGRTCRSNWRCRKDTQPSFSIKAIAHCWECTLCLGHWQQLLCAKILCLLGQHTILLLQGPARSCPWVRKKLVATDALQMRTDHITYTILLLQMPARSCGPSVRKMLCRHALRVHTDHINYISVTDHISYIILLLRVPAQSCPRVKKELCRHALHMWTDRISSEKVLRNASTHSKKEDLERAFTAMDSDSMQNTRNLMWECALNHLNLSTIEWSRLSIRAS